jgi:hypothetical protein
MRTRLRLVNESIAAIERIAGLRIAAQPIVSIDEYSRSIQQTPHAA